MGIGSILVGVAVVLVVGAYLARPFRTTEVDLDQTIDAWVAQVSAEGAAARLTDRGPDPVNFCPQCGRRVGPDDRFCARCGTPLQAGTE